MDLALFIIAAIIALVGGVAFIYIAVKTVRESHEFGRLKTRIDKNESAVADLNKKVNKASKLQKEIINDLGELKKLYKNSDKMDSKRDSE